MWKLHCRTGDWVFLSAKSPEGWRDKAFKYSENLSEELSEWIEEHSPADWNLYFCPLPFDSPRRRKNHVTRSRLLYSDLDTATEYPIKPSILWESSPGRFQAIWILDKEVPAEQAQNLNKGLTYAITNADKGGWDLTQVLRIPGTKNLKYPDHPTVKLIKFNIEKTYAISDIPQATRTQDVENILDKYNIHRRIRRTLFDDRPTVGKRSEVLWNLENQLVEEGMTNEEVIEVVRRSVWNKYKGRSDELERLKTEVEKIRKTKKVEPKPELEKKKEKKQFQVESYPELMSGQASYPGWSVKNYWMRNSHGIVAGEPKSFKSTLVLDLAFSIAARKRFLGITVPEIHGPVVYVNNENAGWILKDRLEKLCAAREELGRVKRIGNKFQIHFQRNLPMYFINQQNFSFDDESNKRSILSLVQDLKPALLIFDPLYLMIEGDVNSAQDLSPHLSWLLDLKSQFPMSLILIHHWNKSGTSQRGGQRMLGSTTLHGWIESAWYLESRQAEKENKAVITMEREFRGAGMPPKIDISLEMGDIGEAHYSTVVSETSVITIEEEILTTLDSSEVPLSIVAIGRRTGHSSSLLKRTLQVMLKDQKVVMDGSKYGRISGKIREKEESI